MKLPDAIKHLYTEGNTVPQIAERLFKPEATVIGYLKRAKLLKLERKPTEAKERPIKPKVAELAARIRALAEKGHSQKEIAQALSVTKRTVINYRQRFDIPINEHRGSSAYLGANAHIQSPQKMVAFLQKQGFKPKVIAHRLKLSLSTVYEYQSRATGNRKPLWKKPKGYKPASPRHKA